MANRRCFQAIARYLHSLRTLAPIAHRVDPPSTQFTVQILASNQSHRISCNDVSLNPRAAPFTRNFCSKHTGIEDHDDDDDESGEEEETRNVSDDLALSAKDKEKEAAEIGYKVVGQLQDSDQVSKPYEPVFAVVQIGSHQFKVSNGDAIFTERLKYCDIHDKLILNKVLMLGSTTQTIIGRPTLPDAAVHAVVEEHALDAKVIVFKKKRRKNYRRTKGHRQELTKLRITDIEGIPKPQPTSILKTEKKDKPQKTAVET